MINGLSRFLTERLVRFKKMVPLSATFFLYLFGWGLISPIFNIRINEITGSLLLSGIIFALLGFVRIFLDPSIGIFCDKFNPKKILQASLLAYVLIFILYTLTNEFISLFLIRFIHAVACAGLWISGWTLVRIRTRGKYAQEEMSSWVAVQDIAYIIAPIIGGIIITFTSWPVVFYLASAFSFLSFLFVTFRVKNPEVKPDGVTKRFRDEFKLFFKERSSMTRLVLLAFIIITVNSAFIEFLPIKLYNSGLSIEEIGLILSLGITMPFVLFPVIVGVLSDKYGRKLPSLIGLLITSFGLFYFAQLTTFTQFLFYTFIITTGYSFIIMCVNAELNDLLPARSEGSFTGIFEMIKDVGYAAGPLIAGAIASGFNISFAFAIMSIMSLASIVILKGFKNY